MKLLYVIIVFVSAVLFLSCKDDPSSPPPVELVKNSSISGKLTFLDGAPGANAFLELKDGVSLKVIKDTICDPEGNFLFKNLAKGDYYVYFNSTGPDINNSQVKVTVDENENVSTEFHIYYKYLDDFKAIEKNSSVYFMQMQFHSGKIGDKYERVNYLSGFFRRDMQNTVTLSSEVYLIPNEDFWYLSGDTLTAEFIRENCQYVTTIFEEPFNNGTHEIRFSGDNIPVILSNPPYGFAFLKNEAEFDKTIRVPCIDFFNNDFGLIINYK